MDRVLGLGTELTEDMIPQEYQVKFWDQVDMSFAPGACWGLRVKPERGGYKRFHVIVNGEKFRYLAHRLSFALSRGPIPAGMYVCHACDNRQCVRPDHLFLGYPSDNTNDMLLKGRKPVGTSVAGAKLTPETAREVYESVESLNTIAGKYGISKKLVLNVKQGRAWRGVGKLAK